MVHFMRTLGALTAVGFGLAALTVTAGAKPPELPIDRKDTCTPAGLHSTDAAVIAGLLLPVEPVLLPADPLQPAPEPSACPYLQKKAAAVEPAPVTFDTPLENLRKLIEAQRLYEKAERCRAAGETLAACATYEQAAKACPGSHFSAAAAVRAAELRAERAAAAGQAECEEPTAPACHDCCKKAGCCDLPVCIDLSAGSACCRVRVAVSFSAGKQLSIGVEAGAAPGPGTCTVKVKAADGCGDGCVGTCLRHWLQVLGGCPCATPEPKDATPQK